MTTITIHRSQRVIYTLRRVQDRIAFRTDIWSFEPNEYTYTNDDSFMDTQTASTPVRVKVPWGGTLVVLRVPKTVGPEHWIGLRVSWESNLSAESVWRLARHSQRGFRLISENEEQADSEGTVPPPVTRELPSTEEGAEIFGLKSSPQ